MLTDRGKAGRSIEYHAGLGDGTRSALVFVAASTCFKAVFANQSAHLVVIEPQ